MEEAVFFNGLFCFNPHKFRNLPDIEIYILGKNSKYYVVWVGRKPGIYNYWAECKAQVEGMEGAVYKSFTSKPFAEKAFQDDYRNYLGKDERKLSWQGNMDPLIGMPDKNSIAVDAACSGNPGLLEYRGVDMRTGTEIFRQGPFEDGTVNIGEFLAIVHGLAYLKKKGLNLAVYSDSRNAIKWVRDKKASTKHIKNNRNEKLFELLERAEIWLKNNDWTNRIIKWPTEYWGEIPADFGRK